MKTSKPPICSLIHPAGIAAPCLALLLTICFAGRVSAATYHVSSPDDSGPKTLRSAVDQANAITGQAHQIIIEVDYIVLRSPLVYDGTNALLIEGRGVEIDATNTTNNGTLFRIHRGADVEMRDLTLYTNINTAFHIVFSSAVTGAHLVSLSGVMIVNSGKAVSISNVSDGDLKINDQRGYYQCERGIGISVFENGAGAVHFETRESEFHGCANGGLKIEEWGDGDLTYLNRDTVFTGNGEARQGASFPGVLDPWGALLSERGDGSFFGTVDYTSANEYLSQDALYVLEHDRGNAHLSVKGGSFSENGLYGMVVREGDSGSLSVELSELTITGNLTIEPREGALFLRELGAGEAKVTLSNCIIGDHPSVGLFWRGLPAVISLDNTLFYDNKDEIDVEPGTQVIVK